MRYNLLTILLGLGLVLSGCSSLKKDNAESFHSGDAIPLYPVTTTGTTSTGIDGRWYIKTVGSITLRHYEDNEWPYLAFVSSEARFYGHDGCNVINGSYRLPSGNALELSNIATTMKLCEGDTLAYPIATALNATHSFSTTNGADGSRTLSLMDAANKVVMTLHSSDIDFLNGAWQVIAINDVPINVPDARLIFDVDANTLTGNAGCNRLRGELTRNPNVSAAVQFSNLSTTRMTCPYIETESALLVALEEVTHARRAKNTIELLDADNKPVIKLAKLTKEDF